jgi:hypothetical protein
MMKRLLLPALCCLAATACVRSPSAVIDTQQEAGKCELVRTLMNEPPAVRQLMQLASEGREMPAPVLVFVRRADEGSLERFFVGEPACADATYSVVRDNLGPSVALFLEPTEGGYTFDVQRVGPEALSLDGAAQGRVKLEGGAWVASSL